MVIDYSLQFRTLLLFEHFDDVEPCLSLEDASKAIRCLSQVPHEAWATTTLERNLDKMFKEIFNQVRKTKYDQ